MFYRNPGYQFSGDADKTDRYLNKITIAITKRNKSGYLKYDPLLENEIREHKV